MGNIHKWNWVWIGGSWVTIWVKFWWDRSNQILVLNCICPILMGYFLHPLSLHSKNVNGSIFHCLRMMSPRTILLFKIKLPRCAITVHTKIVYRSFDYLLWFFLFSLFMNNLFGENRIKSSVLVLLVRSETLTSFT